MNPTNESVEVFPEAETLTRATAQRFVCITREAAASHNIATVGLSGGSTPQSLYTLLATEPTLRHAVPWPKIHFFFDDERHVAPNHPESNFRMANETMFRHLTSESLHVHRVPAESSDASEAAAQYETDMRQFFGAAGLVEAGFPRFALILLGIGADGHTASLFPGTAALREAERWVMANWVETLHTHRITMTLPVLNNAAEIIVLVSGADKAFIIAEVLGRGAGRTSYPVQMVRPREGIKHWMLDKAAAKQLFLEPHEGQLHTPISPLSTAKY